MMNCDVPWLDAGYDTRGLGAIIEAGYWLPDILEARASLGYHFNSHIFLGAELGTRIRNSRSSTRSSWSSFFRDVIPAPHFFTSQADFCKIREKTAGDVNGKPPRITSASKNGNKKRFFYYLGEKQRITTIDESFTH